VSTVARVEICIDCADPEALIPFWMATLGYVRDPRDACGLVDPDGVQPPLWFQRVPEPKTVKNRLHIDAYFADSAAAEQRRDDLVALGGIAVGRFEDFWLMNDPAGNECCLCWPA
jgi:Glyoxalase-like domain